MAKKNKRVQLQATMSLIMGDGTAKPLVTFDFTVHDSSEDMKALSLLKFEEDMLKQYIKFEYSEVKNGDENRDALVS